ncbi:MAG: hypothetical protein ACM3TT_14165 [Syntrophothermus sp.]
MLKQRMNSRLLIALAFLIALALARPEETATVAGWGSAVILKFTTPYRLLPGQEAPLSILKGRYHFRRLPRLSGPILTGQEVLRRRKPAPGGVLVYTPWELRRIPEEKRGDFLLETATAAVRLGVRVVVEASDADAAQITPQGMAAAAYLKAHKVLRVVIFDGAHHLPGLRVPADVLLMPVMRYPGPGVGGGELMVIHGYVRDALPLSWIISYLQRLPAEKRPVMVTIPRLGAFIKPAPAMGQAGLGIWALLAGARSFGRSISPEINDGNRRTLELSLPRMGQSQVDLPRVSLPQAGGKIPVYAISAWDLLWRRALMWAVGFPGKKGLPTPWS